jgi:pSer/pThr/pTyr-binding forkhead associated (FHA) protein/tRNA A-37 threonylcarbamoyl transferase component Bud32
MKIKLTIFEASGNVFDLTVTGDCELVIGRSKTVDVTVDDPLISRRHCIIKVEGGKISIRDLGSINGVILHRRKIKEALLRDRDTIRIGKSRITIASGESSTGSTIKLVARNAARPAAAFECADCGRPVSENDMDKGLAVREKEQVLCKRCHMRREDPLIGLVIGGNRLDERIGSGATGDVYRATQLSMERLVAVKILRIPQDSSQKTVRKFLREAKSCAELSHPNVVHVYNIGEEDGLYYIVMEFVEGKTAYRLIVEKGRLGPRETVAIALQIANALGSAYKKKIVHRDIKPANIIVTPKGDTRLMDFGLAKNFEESGVTGITQPGEGLGTPNYMPPEQVENALTADQRSDIYSLGASMYHMLTGRFPFDDENTMKILTMIFDEKAVPIKNIVPAVPAYVVNVVEKAMQKKPEERYQTPVEMIDDLTAALGKLRKKRR